MGFRLFLFVSLVQYIVLAQTRLTSTPSTPTAITLTTTFTPTTIEDDKPKVCPDKQTAFYKDDLREIINNRGKEKNILEKIRQSFYSNVTNIANDHMLELNAYLTKIQHEPNNILTALDDIKMKREKTIVPLVKTANTTLNELLSLKREEVAKQVAKVIQLLKQKYEAEQFCKYACDSSFRAIHVEMSSQDDYLCSTLPAVLDRVDKRFTSFMEQEPEEVADYLNRHQHTIHECIDELKKTLSESSMKILGVSMANVLHLQHDVIEAIESIEEFNAQHYKCMFEEINANLSMLGTDLMKNIMLYRKECVKCDSMDYRKDVTGIWNPRYDVLDLLLGRKSTEWIIYINEEMSAIFSGLYNKLNDQKLVENILHKLQLLADDVSVKTIQERKAFDDVMQSAPEEKRKLLAHYYHESESMVSTIEKANKEVEDKINNLQKI